MPRPIRAVAANGLLRYLLRDLPKQAEKTRRLIDSDGPVGLTVAALAEIAWTLAGPRCKWGRRQVAVTLVDLLARENIVPVGFDKAEAQSCLLACASRTAAASLGDALIAASARSAGLQEIYSFDRRFSRAGLLPASAE